jgi:hypothetical protein
LLRGSWRKSSVEKGRFSRAKVLVLVKLKLFDLAKNRGVTSWVECNARELAKDGFVIEADRVMVDGFHVFTEAMKEGKGLELQIELPAEGGTLRGKGQVLWFKHTPNGSLHPFEAGVLLMQVSKEAKESWLAFMKSLRD